MSGTCGSGRISYWLVVYGAAPTRSAHTAFSPSGWSWSKCGGSIGLCIANPATNDTRNTLDPQLDRTLSSPPSAALNAASSLPALRIAETRGHSGPVKSATCPQKPTAS